MAMADCAHLLRFTFHITIHCMDSHTQNYNVRIQTMSLVNFYKYLHYTQHEYSTLWLKHTLYEGEIHIFNLVCHAHFVTIPTTLYDECDTNRTILHAVSILALALAYMCKCVYIV